MYVPGIGSLEGMTGVFIACTDIGPIQGGTSGTMTVQEFDQVVLSCPSPASTPPAVIGWTTDSVLISPSADGRVGITLNGDLVISGVVVEETGRHYRCQATNPVSNEMVQSSQSVLLSYNSGKLRHCHV